MPLQFTNLLDPRQLEPGESAAPGCVNIPVKQLSSRVHELPRPGELVQVVAEPALAAETIAQLGSLGREAQLAEPPCSGEAPLRLWRPNSWLEEQHFDPGFALDLACGVGRDAVFLADQRWQVTAVDHLPDALALAKSLRQRYAPAAEVEWVCSAAEDYRPQRLFDLITIFFFLDRDLVRQAVEWLRPGGHLVMETFTVEQHRMMGKPRLAWCLQPGELRDLCVGLEIVSYREGMHDKGYTARVVAKVRSQAR